jgi:hypothetical protein
MTTEAQAIQAAAELLDPSSGDRVGARFDGIDWIVTFLGDDGSVEGRATVNSSGSASVYQLPNFPSIEGSP